HNANLSSRVKRRICCLPAVEASSIRRNLSNPSPSPKPTNTCKPSCGMRSGTSFTGCRGRSAPSWQLSVCKWAYNASATPAVATAPRPKTACCGGLRGRPRTGAGVSGFLVLKGSSMASFKVHGWFEIDYEKRKGGRTLVFDNFWFEGSKSHYLAGERGCYVFAVKTGRGLEPIYVGK